MTTEHDGQGLNGAMPTDPMTDVIVDVVRAFAPFLPPEMAASIASQVLLEQQALAKVIEDALPASESAGKFPIWGFRLLSPQEGKAGLVKAPKALPGANLGDAIQSISVFALLTSPPARAVLYAHGYRLEFLQAPAPVEQKIILPGQ